MADTDDNVNPEDTDSEGADGAETSKPGDAADAAEDHPAQATEDDESDDDDDDDDDGDDDDDESDDDDDDGDDDDDESDDDESDDDDDDDDDDEQAEKPRKDEAVSLSNIEGIDPSGPAENIVIVGAGQAGGSAAAELREQGFGGSITLIGYEAHPPYERPPLSKAYLAGDSEFKDALLHDEEWYEAQNITLMLDTEATKIDTTARSVHTSRGQVPYDRLILATGSRPRRLAALDEAELPVAYLRTKDDSVELREKLKSGSKVAIIGAGFIGLEVASAAVKAGCEVTVFEHSECPREETYGADIAQVFIDRQRAEGVDVQLGVDVDPEDLKDFSLIVVGIGAEPRVELAESAGLEVDNGVVVDATLRTSNPQIWAVGDIASHNHPLLGHRARVEHWDVANEQAKVAARNALGAMDAYVTLPFFWTDQFDLGMEYIGHIGPDGFDDVVIRGNLQDKFHALWLLDEVVQAGMHINDWDSTDGLRALIGRQIKAKRLRDDSVELSEM